MITALGQAFKRSSGDIIGGGGGGVGVCRRQKEVVEDLCATDRALCALVK